MFEFGPYRLDGRERKLICDGEAIPLTPKVFDVLLLLLENANQLVEKKELLTRIWPNTFVEEPVLSQNIFTLRKVLSEHANGTHFIETVPKHGYRLIVPVHIVPAPQDATRELSGTRSLASRGWARIWWAALVTVICSTTAWTAYRWVTRSATVKGLTQLTFDSYLNFEPAISRDGRFIVYVSDRTDAGDAFGGYLNLWRKDLPDGPAVRLTREAAAHTEPDISPDGKTVVFRSSERGGVLATVPATGGASRAFQSVSRARNPRFSPLAHWVAYWTAGDDETQERGAVYVMKLEQTTDGSDPPSRLFADFAHAIHPIWSEDGAMVLAFGTWRSGEPDKEYDAWVVRVQKGLPIGPPIKTGLFPLLKRQNVYVNLTDRSQITAGTWTGRYLTFSAKTRHACNVWRVSLPSPAYVAQGPAQQVTNGAGCESDIRESENGLAVFANHELSYQIYGAALDPAGYIESQGLVKLTDEPGVNMRPSVSWDGMSMAWENRGGRGVDQLRWFDFRERQTRQLARSLARPDITHPLISPDGRFAAYRTVEDHRQVIYREDVSLGDIRRVCADCGSPESWVAQGEKLIYQTGGVPACLGLLDIASGHYRDWITHPSYSLYGGKALLSPAGDGWVAFYADNGLRTRQIFMVEVHQFQPAAAQQWTAITDGANWDVDPAWSADGNRLYFLSQRDGHRCIWAQALDPRTKRPAGQPVPVRHFHSATQTLLHSRPNRGAVGLSAVRGRLFFSMEQHTANVWTTQDP